MGLSFRYLRTRLTARCSGAFKDEGKRESLMEGQWRVSV